MCRSAVYSIRRPNSILSDHKHHLQYGKGVLILSRGPAYVNLAYVGVTRITFERTRHTKVACDHAASSLSFTLLCRCSHPPWFFSAARAALHAHWLDGSRPSNTLSATPCIGLTRSSSARQPMSLKERELHPLGWKECLRLDILVNQ